MNFSLQIKVRPKFVCFEPHFSFIESRPKKPHEVIFYVQPTQVLHLLTKPSLLMLSLASCARILIRMMALVLITRSLSVAKVSNTKSYIFAKNPNFHI